MRIAVIYRELFLLLLTTASCRNAPTTSGHDKSFWYERNNRLIHERMRNVQVDHLPRVRNVVIFIGDGMGTSTITASRVLKRQISKNPSARLTFDDFPATAIVQTDIENSQIAESAASSTALFCGVKTNFENLGVDVTATGTNACENIKSHTPSIVSWAQEKNLKTGLVLKIYCIESCHRGRIV
jgi:alkaline phosphatase